MAITSIGDARTPGRPVEITFGDIAAQPSAVQTVAIVGHAASGAASGTQPAYSPVVINNSSDPVAGYAEAQTKFGALSEAALMVQAAILANSATGNSIFPKLIVVPLKFTDADFGGVGDPALVALNKSGECEFIVSPYAAVSGALLTSLKTQATSMSSAQSVAANQFGTMGVAANRAVTDPSTLFKADTPYLSLCWLRDTGSGGNAPAYSIGQLAAAYAATLAGNGIPFNPLDDTVVGGLASPAQQSDYITVGDNAESETALQAGWTPLKVMPNLDVAITRAVTARISATGTGTPEVTSYFDVQDWQVLFYWRKTEFSTFSTPQWKKAKASSNTAKNMLTTLIGLANSFETQGMFQAVKQLAPLFQVIRDPTDRSAFQYLTPVNVIPGLHRLLGNTQATTDFDSLVF
jgi:phage tail sheath gpL-like